MFGKSFKLFTMFGFKVKIDLSWVIILVLVVWSLAAGVFPREYKGLSTGVYLLMGIAGAFGLFGSIVFHELCHSLVARRFGLPMEGITLFLFGGVAEMSDEPESPLAEFSMAVAGPLASIAIAAVFFAVSLLGAAWGWPTTVVGVLRWIGIINALLAAFNLIPGFPLDGGRVLRSIIWHFKHNLRRATEIASQVGSGFGMFLILLGFLNLVLANPVGGLWWILIGMFLRAAARQGLRQVVIRELLHGEPVKRFMNPSPVTVAPSLTLSELVDGYIYKHHYKMFPVVEDGRLAGCISTREVRSVPREAWPATSVQSVVSQCAADNTIGPDEDAMKALEKMSRTKLSRMMVVNGDRLVGILSLKDLLKFLSLKLELEPGAASNVSIAGAGGDDSQD